MEQAVPRVKLTLSNTLTLNKLSIYLRNTFFGETTEATSAGIFDDELNYSSEMAQAWTLAGEGEAREVDAYNTGKVITDLSFGYQFAENLSLTLGANNLLDIYPDEADSAFRSSGRFVYSRRSPQFSFGGRYLFARLIFTLQ